MKHLNPNDPEFTAKALGEHISDNENSIVSDAFKKEFEALQQFAKQVKNSIEDNRAEEKLEAEQIEAIDEVSIKSKNPIIRFPYWTGGIAALFIVALILPLYRPAVEDSNREREILFVSETLQTQVPEPVEGRQKTVITELSLNDEVLTRPLNEKEYNDPLIGLDALMPVTLPSEATEAIFHLPVVTKQDVNVLGGVVSQATDSEVFELSSFIAEVPAKAEMHPRKVAFLGNLAHKRGKSQVVAESLIGYRLDTPVVTTSMNDSVMPTVFPCLIRSDRPEFNREAYSLIEENSFLSSVDHPLSTFSIDVDTASYSNVRRFIQSGTLPPRDAVRIEEMINYFSYDYTQPEGKHPFAVKVSAAESPWQTDHRLVRIALKGGEVAKNERPAANLAFLIDVSGSMNSQNKLPLVKESLGLLIEQMNEKDRIAIVVYAGASGLALPSTTANNMETIKHAMDRLRAGGSTNGGAGIALAYEEAKKHFIKRGINRVILCTDGDFNVGMTDQGSLVDLIAEQAKSGIFFSAVGFGRGNYNDATMELLSNRGNGNYAYIDSRAEARKVFVTDMIGTLMSIAKDVKIQVEFNPTRVGAYRLIGYENRSLAKEDFNNDKVDAGDIGAGHTVTALYEVIPSGLEKNLPDVDALKYQKPQITHADSDSEELLTVKLRYKLPDEDISRLITVPFEDAGYELANCDDDFRFAAGVAALGMKLRGSEYVSSFSYDMILELLENSQGNDSQGMRSGLLELLKEVKELQNQ